MSNLVNPYGVGANSGEPLFSQVGLLLHMEGTNGGTSFTDSSSNGHTVTPTSVTTDTSQFQFGSSSAKFATSGGGSNKLSIAHHSSLDMPTGDFSLECWVRITTTGVNHVLMQKATGSGFYPWQLLITSANKIEFRGFDNSNVSAFDAVGSTSFTTNTWYFVQARRSGNAIAVAMNGGLEAIGSFSGTLRSNSSDPVVIGNSSGAAVVGFMDDVRITKGYAVAFTNRATTFPDS